MRIAKQVHDVTGARVPTWQRLKAAVRGSQEEKGALYTKQDRHDEINRNNILDDAIADTTSSASVTHESDAQQITQSNNTICKCHLRTPPTLALHVVI